MGELRAQSEGGGCGTRATLPIHSEQFQERLQRINDYKEKYINREKHDPPIIAIPVVVHILYDCDNNNIWGNTNYCTPYYCTIAEVNTAIERLNRDFRTQNAGVPAIPGYFQPFVGTTSIQFCLATRNEEGEETTGVEYSPAVDNHEYEIWDTKLTDPIYSGLRAWDVNRYLNIWVVPKLVNGLPGYAHFPSFNLHSDDGIVLDFNAFKNTSSSILTHETGHWLGLHHTFGTGRGQGPCLDSDGISDTPTQGGGHKDSNGNVTCFSYPYISCNNGPNGDMNTNFMNLSTCLSFFTNDQCRAMEATLEPNGERPGLLTSLACRRAVHNIKPGQFGGNVYNITWDPSEWPDAVGRYEVRWRYVNLCKYFPWQYPPGSLIWGTAPGITLQFNYGQKVEIQIRDLGDPSWSASHIIITGSGGGTPDSFYEPNNNSVSTAPDIGQGSDLSISGRCGYSYWPVPTHDPDIYRFYNSGNVKLSIYTSNDGNGTPSFVVESASNAWQQYYPSRERGNINLATNVESINLDAAGVPRGYCLVTITGNGYYTFRKEQCELVISVDEPYFTPKNMRITEEEEGMTLPIKCYPNPTSDILSLEGLDESQQYLLELFSLDGRKIAEKETTGLGTHFMDISNQEEGIYCLRCKSKSGSAALMVSKISR